MPNALLENWNRIWEKHANEFIANGSRWANDEWREPFQLLGAALIYIYNALNDIPEIRLHQIVRDEIAQPKELELWKGLNGKDPQFCADVAEGFKELRSTMHLASSAFRLTTAVFLIHKGLIAKANGPFIGVLKENVYEWDRKELKHYLEESQSLACCVTGSAPDEHTALAMSLAYRDEFGHGVPGLKCGLAFVESALESSSGMK